MIIQKIKASKQVSMMGRQKDDPNELYTYTFQAMNERTLREDIVQTHFTATKQPLLKMNEIIHTKNGDHYVFNTKSNPEDSI